MSREWLAYFTQRRAQRARSRGLSLGARRSARCTGWRVNDLIDFQIDDAVNDVFEMPRQGRGGPNRMLYAVAARADVVNPRASGSEQGVLYLARNNRDQRSRRSRKPAKSVPSTLERARRGAERGRRQREVDYDLKNLSAPSSRCGLGGRLT